MRILFVAMPGSVHTARWINQLADQGWDIHLVAATGEPLHPDIRNVTAYCFSAFRYKGLDPSVRIRGLWPLRRGSSVLGEKAGRLLSWDWALAAIIRRLKPDILHTMEIQHAGYLASKARARLKGHFPTWVVSNWGSDIYLYGRLPEHEEKIRGVLSACDYYHVECHRDVELARRFGFEGKGSFVLPLAGGFDIDQTRQFRQPGPTSARRLIALKGYQGWVYRGLVGLRALELCADVLEGYRIALYSANSDAVLAAKLVSRKTGVTIDVIPRGSHEDMLRLHGSARASICLSVSDALNTSALEALVMGSFPIQSNTSCIGEMLQDGESGLLVHPEDPEPIAQAIRRAVTDDDLVDRAAEINARVASEHLDSAVVKPRSLEMYREIAAHVVLKKP